MHVSGTISSCYPCDPTPSSKQNDKLDRTKIVALEVRVRRVPIWQVSGARSPGMGHSVHASVDINNWDSEKQGQKSVPIQAIVHDDSLLPLSPSSQLTGI